MSNTLRPHELQHTRLPCPSLSPWVCSNSCTLSQWCHPIIYSLLPPSPLALNLSHSRVFSSESALHISWTKYWSFSFSVSPSNEYSGLISFRIDWFDVLSVQGTLKSLLQYHSSKASTLQCSALFLVQLSHPHMTIGKTIALTRQTFVGKVMSLLFNILSRMVIAILQRSKHLLFHGCSQHLQWFCNPWTWNLTLFPSFPHLFALKWWDQMPWSLSFECWVLSQFFTLLFHLHQEAV